MYGMGKSLMWWKITVSVTHYGLEYVGTDKGVPVQSFGYL